MTCHKHQTWNLACGTCTQAMELRSANLAKQDTREVAQIMRQARS